MSEFQIKNHSIKIFTKQHKELTDRFDAQFYWENMNFDNCVKLSSVAKVSGGKRLPKGFDYSKDKTDYRYLRIGDIDWNGNLDFENFEYLSEELFNILEHYEIKKGDLMLAIVGATIGKCSLLNPPYEDRIILTENCAKIKVRSDNVLPEYLYILLQTKFVQKQIQLNYIQTTLPKLGLDRVLSLKFPEIPDETEQKKIIDLFHESLNSKKEKEYQAKQLLESIDEYLLHELGITLPEKDNSLENRIFTTSSGKVSGGRFDPFYFLYCIESPESTKYNEVKLKEIASIVKGQSITSADIVEGEYPVIAGGQTSPYSHNQYNHDGNVITISASGAYSGFAWYHTTPIFASDCSVIKSRNEQSINTEFLFNVLKLKQTELYNLQQGSGQPHVYPSDIYKIGIPLPKIDKQIEINDYIRQMREQIKELQHEAVEGFEKAKQVVEQIILDNA